MLRAFYAWVHRSVVVPANKKKKFNFSKMQQILRFALLEKSVWLIFPLIFLSWVAGSPYSVKN